MWPPYPLGTHSLYLNLRRQVSRHEVPSGAISTAGSQPPTIARFQSPTTADPISKPTTHIE
ncbi:MAG TPA: hypothetical protein VF510_20610, partial [Ktedonobacterales bacterium]